MRALTHWDHRYLGLAEHVSQWSKDPSTKVGAVLTRNNRILSLGFNGLPQGVADTPERLDVREVKLKIIRHGEENAMDFAEQSIAGATLYTFPFMPCAHCAGQAIQRGIAEVVSIECYRERWMADFALTKELFAEAGVALVLRP